MCRLNGSIEIGIENEIVRRSGACGIFIDDDVVLASRADGQIGQSLLMAGETTHAPLDLRRLERVPVP